jgi:hypothetical protein
MSTVGGTNIPKNLFVAVPIMNGAKLGKQLLERVRNCVKGEISNVELLSGYIQQLSGETFIR